MKTLIIAIVLLTNIVTSQGSFTYLGEEGAHFKSYDDEVWWYLEYEDLGFIPEKGKTYTIIYDNNNTKQNNYCTHQAQNLASLDSP